MLILACLWFCFSCSPRFCRVKTQEGPPPNHCTRSTDDSPPSPRARALSTRVSPGNERTKTLSNARAPLIRLPSVASPSSPPGSGALKDARENAACAFRPLQAKNASSRRGARLAAFRAPETPPNGSEETLLASVSRARLARESRRRRRPREGREKSPPAVSPFLADESQTRPNARVSRPLPFAKKRRRRVKRSPLGANREISYSTPWALSRFTNGQLGTSINGPNFKATLRWTTTPRGVRARGRAPRGRSVGRSVGRILKKIPSGETSASDLGDTSEVNDE